MPSPGASHACPACGRELDPLRAGQVAVLEGGFVYFCDQACKARWAQQRGGVASNDVETAEPPPVAPAPATASEPVVESLPEAPPEVEHEIERDDEPRSLPLRHWGAPEEIMSVSRPEPRIAPPPTAARSRSAWLGYGGAVAGTLAIGVALVGASGDALRLPLAIVACACALAYAAAIAERLLVRTLWPGAVAVVVAGGCAIASRPLGAADAHMLASFAGVTAASFVAVCATMLRAVEPVTAARESILAALDLRARASDGGSRPASEVRAGEQVEVGEGELVPVDGVVSVGDATVSPWLDSGNEVRKREGAPVIAGARVLSGALRVVASWTGPDRAYVKLLATDRHRIELAAPLARLARLFDTRALVPLGLLSGAGAFANGASPLQSVACGAAALAAFGAPVVSVSVALLHARGHLRALRHGVVHRDAVHFDRAGRAGIAVVCARGTVLLGEPEIVAIEPVGDREPSEVLALAAAMCTGSSHPFAAAVLRAARARHVKSENVRNPVHIGSGATALDASGERIVLGRRSFLLSEKVSIAVADDLVREHESQGRSVLLVARGGRVAGLVALQDGLRAGARAAIQKLHDARIEPVLLSGEARETCETIGRALDIEHLRPEVAGPDRGAEVRTLTEGGDVVAVLGHPAADDSALGAADVSVALDAAGANPGEWGVTLASDDVRDGAEALTIPRDVRERTFRAMAALIPGTLAVLTLAFGLMPLWAAPPLGAIVASLALLYAKD